MKIKRTFKIDDSIYRKWKILVLRKGRRLSDELEDLMLSQIILTEEKGEKEHVS